MTKKTNSPSLLVKPLDRTHAYALKVLAGKIVAGPHVRAAAQRFCDDLANGEERGLRYDVAAADRAFQFFERVLKLTGGQFEGNPFLLHESQCFIVGNIFGWKRIHYADGHSTRGRHKKIEAGECRRFRRAYIEIGKGNGKTPMAAGICLYGLLADGEARAEIYIAAAKKEQAMIAMRDARNMVHLSPALQKVCDITGGDHQPNIAYLKLGNRLTVMSSEKSMSGFRPHFALCDEVHEHRSRHTIDMLERGFKSRINPLLIMITNSGTDRKSVAWEEHEHAIKVAHQTLQDDNSFSYVCALDEDDDPLENMNCWIKANPLLGTSLSYENIGIAVKQAKNMIMRRNEILRLHFCVWTDSESSWMKIETWKHCENDLRLQDYYGQTCYLGLDLSRTTDLTALAIIFPMPNGELHVFMDFWLPRARLHEAEERDKAPYTQWHSLGYMHAPEGLEVDYGWVFKRIAEINAVCPVKVLGYDRYMVAQMQSAINEHCFHAFDCEETGAGMKSISAAFNKLEDVIISEKLKIASHPIMRWMVQCTTVEMDASGNQKYTKKKSRGRIDGVAALCHGISMVMKHHHVEQFVSVYETRGIIAFEL